MLDYNGSAIRNFSPIIDHVIKIENCLKKVGEINFHF